MTTYRCPQCSIDLEIQFTMGNQPYATCNHCKQTWRVPPNSGQIIEKQPDGSLKRMCNCGCKYMNPYDPTREGRDYDPNADWVKMLDIHARPFIDMPIVKKEFIKQQDLTSVKAGIFVKMGPQIEGLRYLNRLLKSVMISDVRQPMVIWLHGWGVGDSSDQTHMSDIYMGRDQGVPMLARQMENDGILAMVDQDIVLPPRWYSHVREVFDKDPSIGALYPMIQLEADTAIQLVQVEYQGGWQSGGYGPNTVHNYNPNNAGYIHKGPGLIYLDDAKIMGTFAWRCTDMAVFYRASMVKDGLEYTHDWSRFKLKQGFKTVLDKGFVLAHYKEFNERGFGNPNKQEPFFACKKCNHICGWGMAGTFRGMNFCPTCNTEPIKVE